MAVVAVAVLWIEKKERPETVALFLWENISH